MKKIILLFAFWGIAMMMSMPAHAQKMSFENHGDTTIVKIIHPTKYLILPVQEEKDQKQVKLDTGSPLDTWMDIRLAENKIDYDVPFELGTEKTATVKIIGLRKNDIALKKMRLSDTWNVINTDYYRPIFHHTPMYGWMNDACGLFYKDGIYNLCFQYNPYGSKWGNMHWGHAVSKDLIHWKQVEPAIARDTMGHIFSGSSVVDINNTAGYGKGAVVAFYTSASPENGQIQCMAYSTDNGMTFTKYQDNPILTPFDGLANFRDPKVFWYSPKKAWYMIVSADKEMRFYKSHNLKDWTYISAFGKGYGVQPNQFECPDFFPLKLGGKEKWVMIVNINPGCLFGGSATEYFIGDFDGRNFKCDDAPEVEKFLDYGKDHYATVTFSNTESRVIGMPWMSNWQYANVTPTKYFRGENALPRDLSLFKKDGEFYMAANVVPEVKELRHGFADLSNIKNGSKFDIDKKGNGAVEITVDVTPLNARVAGFDLSNAKGEKVKIYLNMKKGKLVMDRTESGLTDFGKLAVPHNIEKAFDEKSEMKTTYRQRNAINYKNDFALGTWAPLSLCEGKIYHLDIFVDKNSIEIFVDGGRIAMTNLVFPTKPYDSIFFYSEGGDAQFSDGKVYKLKM